MGHQIRNKTESFTFKYGSCAKELPFICIKALNVHELDTGAGGGSDRCHSFRREYPGGNWIECDDRHLVMSITRSLRLETSVSQKCCLFSHLNSKKTFQQASSTCSRFDSIVYSFKTKGYKEILETYASYLNMNRARSNENGFWTSCRKSDDDEIKCDASNKQALKSSASSSRPGFYIAYLSHRKGKFRLNFLNMSSLMEVNQTYLGWLYKLSSLTICI